MELQRFQNVLFVKTKQAWLHSVKVFEISYILKREHSPILLRVNKDLQPRARENGPLLLKASQTVTAQHTHTGKKDETHLVFKLLRYQHFGGKRKRKAAI